MIRSSSRTMRTAMALALTVPIFVALSAADSGAQIVVPARSSDFDGDGFADLAIGVPFEDTDGGVTNFGKVQVLYGTANGLGAGKNQQFSQGTPDIPDDIESDDRFGSVAAWGDFDADGFADLAIGVPGEDIGDAQDAGAVNVLYGTPEGLKPPRAQLWTQADLAGLTAPPETGDAFGSALATGDVNGDGRDDLAIGAPLEDHGPGVDRGVVHIVFGSSTGLLADGTTQFSQFSSGSEAGAALAIGNLRGDSALDVAIGVPGAQDDRGAITYLNAQIGGPPTLGETRFFPQTTADPGDRMGAALAAGDLGGDAHADLAIGIPGDDAVGNSIIDAGRVVVFISPGDGPGEPFISIHQEGTLPSGGPAIAGTRQQREQFGSSLAIGAMDSSPPLDLAIGVPGDVRTIPVRDFDLHVGGVNVVYGRNGVLTGEGNQLWRQGSGGLVNTSESGDRFGFALASTNYGGPGAFADLAVGVPGEDTVVTDDGAVQVLYGDADGLTAAGNQFWHQGSPDILEDPEAGDQFGSSLAQRPQRARLDPSCGGFIATIDGRHADGTIAGTAKADVIQAGGGDDTVKAAGGNDRACGDGGDDDLRGNGGDDVLIGGRGIDVARGGPGVDRCKAETEIGCER